MMGNRQPASDWSLAMPNITDGPLLRQLIEKGGTDCFLLVNAHAYVTGAEVRIPPEVIAQIPAGVEEVPIYWTTPNAIREAGIQSMRQDNEFIAGRPMLVRPRKVEWLGDRPHGGQVVEGDEKAALDGLCSTVVLVTETVRGCRDAAEHRILGTEARRVEILAAMALPLSSASCFKRGQANLKNWFSGTKASTVMNNAYSLAGASTSGQNGKVNFEEIETEQLRLVDTASIIYEKVLQFRKAQHALSEAELTGITVPTATLMELAHAKQMSPSIDDFTAAAIMMDFNPARAFSNVYSFEIVFDIGMRLGRVHRGFETWLPHSHSVKLEHLITQADAADKADPSLVNDTDRAARRLRSLALI
jgi:hypothetical protein